MTGSAAIVAIFFFDSSVDAVALFRYLLSEIFLQTQ
jgi:hypothetical protein